MVKKKKRKEKEQVWDLAPSYIGLYASLMTILLAFFILLTTMSDDQESGFNDGIGKVKNSFGLKGGFGLLQFSQMLGGPRLTPQEESAEPDDTVEPVEFDQMKHGSGGPGNTDAKPSKYRSGEYIMIKIPHDFEGGSYRISNDLAAYLQMTGAGLALFEYALNIRCFAEETGLADVDQLLALHRASSIMRYLHQACDIPFERMRAVGYATSRYFPTSSMNADKLVQTASIYVFMHSQSRL